MRGLSGQEQNTRKRKQGFSRPEFINPMRTYQADTVLDILLHSESVVSDTGLITTLTVLWSGSPEMIKVGCRLLRGKEKVPWG